MTKLSWVAVFSKCLRRCDVVLQKTSCVGAWVGTAIVGYASLAPVKLVYQVYDRVAAVGVQPRIENYVHFEHLIAYGALGLLFSLAYRRHRYFIWAMLLALTAFLEVLQGFTADRHGRVFDAIEKGVGVSVGIVLGYLVARGIRALQLRLPCRLAVLGDP